MRDIPALLKYCALAVISDGAKNEVGTTYTPFEFFYEWKKIDNEDKAGKGLDTLRTLVRGAFRRNVSWRSCATMSISPIRRKRMTRPKWCAAIHNSLPLVKLRDHILSHLRSVGGDGKGWYLFRRHRVWKDLYHAVPCSPVGTALPRATG